MSQNRDLEKRDKDPYSRSVAELEKVMEEMPDNMRSFSLCLRQLYVEKAVGTNEEAAVKFRKIRDETRNDTIVYLQGVLPLSTKLISSIDEFFDYFTELDAVSWRSSILIIEDSVNYCSELCKTVKHLHEDIISSLRQREEDVLLVMNEMKCLQETLTRKKATLEKRSKSKHNWAWRFIHGEDSQRAAEMFSSANVDMVKAIAHGAQAQAQGNAVEAVSNTLIPALKYFVDGLEKVTNFFMVLKSNGIGNFNMDKRKAIQIKRYCQKFISAPEALTRNEGPADHVFSLDLRFAPSLAYKFLLPGVKFLTCLVYEVLAK
ncbi:hypothetical protein AC249_AIPGENE27344 [Exaiptasia diaphana]|nr:hypothetical protein AC249_AIPGENE27344 [Exaiptasia diaphana]